MQPETVREVGRVPHGSSDDPDIVDFSANTNPRVPDGIEEIYREAFADARSYPAEPPEEYRATAAAYVGCEPAQVIPTPGGLAAIRATISLAIEPGESALVPYPSFAEYGREIRLHDGDPELVPQAELLDADPTDHALAVVCNPNNPTGNAYDPDRLDAFAERCRAAGTTLLVDEAFLGFTDRPSLAGRGGSSSHARSPNCSGCPAFAPVSRSRRVRSVRRCGTPGGPGTWVCRRSRPVRSA